MKHRGLIVIVVLLLLVILSSSVLASSSIGITPPKQEFFMLPGTSDGGSFRILYGEPYPSVANVKVSDDLKDYIIPDVESVDLPAGGPGPSIGYRIVLPEDMEGKTLVGGNIRVELTPPLEYYKRTGVTGAFAAIGMVMTVRLPKPGRYLEMEFLPTENVNVGEIVYFTIKVRNIGTDTLDDVFARIKIKDQLGKVMTTVETGRSTLSSGEMGELYSYWETGDALPSFYTAEAEIDYGGDIIAKDISDFLVGDLVVKILNVTTNTSHREVTKFNIMLQSLWNAPIDNVYARISVFNSSNADVGWTKSTSETIGPRGVQTLSAYFDSGHLPEGSYNAHIEVNYAEKTVEKIVGFFLEGDKTRDRPKAIPYAFRLFSGTNVLLMILILLLANLLAFLLLTRKRDGATRQKRPVAQEITYTNAPQEQVRKVAAAISPGLMSDSGISSQGQQMQQDAQSTDTLEKLKSVDETLTRLQEMSRR
jgi:uncharacterized repeat protein (TIGR01451 family)